MQDNTFRALETNFFKKIFAGFRPDSARKAPEKNYHKLKIYHRLTAAPGHSSISHECEISAAEDSIARAEQYFSTLKPIARSAAARVRFFPRSRKRK